MGIAAPFGRVETDQLRKLAGEMAAFGVKEIRLSPWRILYAEVPGASAARSILNVAAGCGLIADPSDPLLRIEACPGAPACRSTSLDTRGDARRLAALLPRSSFEGTVHISGCAKGCAKSAATDLVLVVTQILRSHGVVEKFVEFFGEGLSSMSVADRATIANMSPEYGATMGFFPVDDQTLSYLRLDLPQLVCDHPCRG